MKIVEREAGQSLVEFALAGVILMTITFGMMETGRLVYTASVVQAAAQEGARAAIVDEGVIDGTITAAALQAIIGPAVESKMVALDLAQVTVDRAELEEVTMPAAPAPIVRTTVAVEITYTYQFMIPMIGRLLSESNSIALQGKANMLVR